MNAYRLVERRRSDLPQKIFLAAGDREWKKFRESTGAFADHLAALGVEHRYLIYEGGHGWEDWLPAIEQAMIYAAD
jgi:enterochelin esterase-like enzyme